ncbi:hypothetical protein CKO28_13060 [Rhodovibrio sodomensis]|uniref:N-acetyltransferase domain-containing protein n=1 Tax=Rhodovibrio sodomensis TaxID=1088 RepID=A0ABS1DG69_9PROT|nr:hypothetical protein [Rhodovibrio sodomensis]
MRLFEKLTGLRRAVGWYNAALYLLDRGADRLGLPLRARRYYFVVQPVQGPRLPARRGRGLQVKTFDTPSPELAQLPLTEDVIRYRFDQRATCFCVFRDDTVAGCLWLCPGDYVEDEVSAVYRPLPENATVWDFDVYVDPNQRGALVFPKLWDEANASLRTRGVRWSVSRISAFNEGSLAAHRRLGARVVGAATFLRLGPLQAASCSLGPRVHFSAARSKGPLIRVPVEGPDGVTGQ